MLRKFGTWFSGLSKVGRTGVVLASLFVVGAAASPATKPTTQPPSTSTTQLHVKTDTVEKKTITETQTVSFTKTTAQDATLLQGTTELKTAGVDGVKTFTYEVTLTNGVETNRKLVKEEVTTSPVNEVTAVGTKAPQPVCPNGTYTNTYGNEVCRPYESPSTPPGATAQCSDGTYSYSQSRSGTCSHHGGVARWL